MIPELALLQTGLKRSSTESRYERLDPGFLATQSSQPCYSIGGILRHHSKTSDASMGEKLSVNKFERNSRPGSESIDAFTCRTGRDVICSFQNKME